MTDKEQTTFMIDKYMDLLRVKKAGKEAWENEIDNQICQTKAYGRCGRITENQVFVGCKRTVRLATN